MGVLYPYMPGVYISLSYIPILYAGGIYPISYAYIRGHISYAYIPIPISFILCIYAWIYLSSILLLYPPVLRKIFSEWWIPWWIPLGGDGLIPLRCLNPPGSIEMEKWHGAEPPFPARFLAVFGALLPRISPSSHRGSRLCPTSTDRRAGKAPPLSPILPAHLDDRMTLSASLIDRGDTI